MLNIKVVLRGRVVGSSTPDDDVDRGPSHLDRGGMSYINCS